MSKLPKIDANGDQEWYNDDGALHRENDLPAVIWYDGTKSWYQNGLLHRLNGPAIEYLDGSKYWCQNGLLHRLNGPAIEWNNGSKKYFIDGRQYTHDSLLKFLLS